MLSLHFLFYGQLERSIERYFETLRSLPIKISSQKSSFLGLRSFWKRILSAQCSAFLLLLLLLHYVKKTIFIQVIIIPLRSSIDSFEMLFVSCTLCFTFFNLVLWNLNFFIPWSFCLLFFLSFLVLTCYLLRPVSICSVLLS